MDAEPLLTVQDLASKWGVDVTTIRWWCKTKRIPFQLVGPRKVRYIAESAAVVPIVAPVPTYPPGMDPNKENDIERQLGEGSASQDGSGAVKVEAERNPLGVGRSEADTPVKGRSGGTTGNPGSPERRGGGKTQHHRDRR